MKRGIREIENEEEREHGEGGRKVRKRGKGLNRRT